MQWRDSTSDKPDDRIPSVKNAYPYPATVRDPLPPRTLDPSAKPLTFLQKSFGMQPPKLLFNAPEPYGPGEAPPLVHPLRNLVGDLGLLFNLAPEGFENADSILTDGSHMAAVHIVGYRDNLGNEVDVFGTVGSGNDGREDRAPDFRVNKAAYLAHVRECFKSAEKKLLKRAADKQGMVTVTVNDVQSLHFYLCNDQTIANLGTHTACQVLAHARLPVTTPSWFAALDHPTRDRLIEGLSLWCDEIISDGLQAQGTRAHSLAYHSVGDERFKRRELAKSDLFATEPAAYELSVVEGLFDPHGRWMPGAQVMRRDGATGQWVAGKAYDVGRGKRGGSGEVVYVPVWSVAGATKKVTIAGAFSCFPIDTEPGGSALRLRLPQTYLNNKNEQVRVEQLLAAYQAACDINGRTGGRARANDDVYAFKYMIDTTRLVPLRNKTDLGSASFHVHLRYNILGHVAHHILPPQLAKRKLVVDKLVPTVKDPIRFAKTSADDGGLAEMLKLGHKKRLEVEKARIAARKVKLGGEWQGKTLAQAHKARAFWVRTKFGSGTMSKKDLSSQMPLLTPHPPHRSSVARHPLRPPLPFTLRKAPAAAPLSSSPSQRDATLDTKSTPWLGSYASAPVPPSNYVTRKDEMGVWAVDKRLKMDEKGSSTKRHAKGNLESELAAEGWGAFSISSASSKKRRYV